MTNQNPIAVESKSGFDAFSWIREVKEWLVRTFEVAGNATPSKHMYHARAMELYLDVVTDTIKHF